MSKAGYPKDWPTCACGCGRPVEAAKKSRIERGLKVGDPNRFILGHANRKTPHAKKTNWKVCGRCRKEKPQSEFHLNRTRADGLQRYCKKCNREQLEAWADANPDADAAARKRWAEEHSERLRELQRDNRAQNRERERTKERGERLRHPEKDQARQAVSYAVRSGSLLKPDHCESCGALVDSVQLHGHHDDYSKPLEVEWLCVACHTERHRKDD